MSFRDAEPEFGVCYPGGEVVDGFETHAEALEYATGNAALFDEVGVVMMRELITELTDWEVCYG